MRSLAATGLALLFVGSLAHADPARRSSRVAVALPGAPDPDVDYLSWLGEQTQDIQIRISRFCTQHPLSYQALCGGIGPLHVPPPPDEWSCHSEAAAPLPALPGVPHNRAEWRKTLTADQRHYADQKCRLGRGADSDLCGHPQERHCTTPLVVSFDDRPVTFTPGARFAFAPGMPVATDWPTAATPWIALDRDGDGAITSGEELFGDHTPLPGGAIAHDGFAALAALDANHDGQIDAADPAFASLVLWSGDAIVPLARSIVSISLAHHTEPRCDARGNCEGARASFAWRDASGLHTGTVVDVYLEVR